MSKIERYKKKLKALELKRRDERLTINDKNPVYFNLKRKSKQKGNSTYKQKYLDYLKSDEWLKIRLEMLRFYNFTCSRCNLKMYHKKLQVHHKTYKNIFHEEAEDLELICNKCHKKEHGIY